MSDMSLTFFDPLAGSVEDVAPLERRLSDLRGYFADEAVFARHLAQADPVIYTVASVQPAEGAGQLHYGIGKIAPGRIGDEFFMTKGHFHEWRPAAECYIGLSGEGAMLLEDEHSGDSRLISLLPNSVVYVPGATAHRTINTGSTPLVYMGVYPAEAGHDYGVIAERNFRKVVIAGDTGPILLDRADFLERLSHPQTEDRT